MVGLKKLIFNSFYFERDVVNLERTDFISFCFGLVWLS